jgi:hypothetical protein
MSQDGYQPHCPANLSESGPQKKWTRTPPPKKETKPYEPLGQGAQPKNHILDAFITTSQNMNPSIHYRNNISTRMSRSSVLKKTMRPFDMLPLIMVSRLVIMYPLLSSLQPLPTIEKQRKEQEQDPNKRSICPARCQTQNPYDSMRNPPNAPCKLHIKEDDKGDCMWSVFDLESCAFCMQKKLFRV